MTILEAVEEFDETVLRAINGLAGQNMALDTMFAVITAFGMSYVLVLFFFPLWLARRRLLAVDLLVVVLVSIAFEMLLKALFARDRPFVVLDDLNSVRVDFLNTASGYSFPSGHATRAFAVGVLMWLSFRNPAKHLIVLGAALVAVSRVFLGLHWPTDVIAGALLGTFLAVVVFKVGKTSVKYIAGRTWIVSHLERATALIRRRI